MCARLPGPGAWSGTLVLAGLAFFTPVVHAQIQFFPYGTWSEVAPPSRSDHTAIYDPVGDRMIMFGGAEVSTPHNEVWTLSLSGTPAWTLMNVSWLRPTPRSGHSAIYDPVRQRMLVFGGRADVLSYEVWALSLTGTPAWTPLNPSGVPPSAREGHTAIYDPVADRMLVFGGNDGAFKQDVWELTLGGTPAWTPLTPAGTPPAARQGASAIYDPPRQRMLVFGGQLAGNTFANETWALDLSGAPAWSAVATTGTLPAARAYHGAFFDPIRDRMVVVHGGVSLGFAGTRDVAALSLGGTPQWQVLTPFTWTWHSTAVYDAPRDRLVIHGGLEGGACFNTAIQIALSSSPPLAVTPLLPPSFVQSAPAIIDGTAVLDPLNNRMVVFGGQYAGSGFEPQYNNTAYALTLGTSPTWTSLGSHPMGGRFGHSASTVNDGTPRMVIFGGTCHHLCSGVPYNDVWQLGFAPGSTWQQLTPTGTKPTARLSHTSIWDPSRNSLIIFGGSTEDLFAPIVRFNDVWELNLDGTPSWTLWTPVGTPPTPRTGHTAIYDTLHQRMVVFGGRDAGGTLGDTWALSLSGTPTWTQLTTVGPGGPREEHVAVYDAANQRMLVQGGLNAGAEVVGLRLDVTLSWFPFQHLRGTNPDTRSRHGAVLDGQGQMWLYGGLSMSVWKHNQADLVSVPGPAGDAITLLEGARPNPARDGVTIQLSLPDGAPARLDLIDLAGRTVATREVGALGAGRHAVRFVDSRLPAGVYFVRLVRGSESTSAKVVVIPG